MSEFNLWFSTGFEHICDLAGYDHILFVTLLVLALPLTEWKKLLLLITGFTIGHSISLLLSVTNVIKLQQNIVEVFIAFTILITAIFHIKNYKNSDTKNVRLLYFLIPLFGGIHGLGFSYLLRSMLGQEQNVALPLFYFNIGLEAGQVLIVILVLVFSLLLTSYLKCPFKFYKLSVSCIIALVSLIMFAQRLLLFF
jgi:HupE / UreJ protein